MDIERALVSKIISTGQLDEVVSKDIGPDLFADEECRDMFTYIQSHTRRYKSPPSMEAAKEVHPEFEWEHIQEPMKWVIDRFQILVRKRLAQELVFELGAAIDDPDKQATLELEFLEAAREMATIVPSDEVKRFAGDMPERVKEYEHDVETGLKPGIPFGFPTLDDMTGGIQSHEFITCAAFSGVGKSTLLRAIAYNVFAQPEDYVGMYIALEEDHKAILRKFDARQVGLDYKAMKALGLGGDELDRWREYAEEISKKINKRDILILDKIRGCTPDKIFAETVKHKPDIVFIDYLSLMRSSSPTRQSSMWQSLTEITQDLKQNARVLDIPIVAAAQTNRSSAKDGADLDNIGYALSVVQDSDIVLGLHADEEMKEQKRMEIRVRKNREGRLGKISAIWNHEEMDFREEMMDDRFGKSGAKPKASKQDPPRLTRKAVADSRKRSRPTRETPKAVKKRPTKTKKRPTRK